MVSSCKARIYQKILGTIQIVRKTEVEHKTCTPLLFSMCGRCEQRPFISFYSSPFGNTLWWLSHCSWHLRSTGGWPSQCRLPGCGAIESAETSLLISLRCSGQPKCNVSCCSSVAECCCNPSRESV